MRRHPGWLVLALCAAAPAIVAAEKKPAPEPFYRKYLVPGDPLDDKIIEQEKRVEASPDDANLRNDFGNLLVERRFPAQAAEQYEIALKLDKKNFISAYNLGLMRETEGKYSQAISAYRRSIKRKPGFPQSRFRLGRLYEHTNEPESAVREYAAALWIDPGMRDPKRNPLIVDCELVYLASLVNYRRDVAVAAMTESEVFFEADRFRKLPTNRAIGAKEVEGEAPAEAAAPREVGAPAPVGATGASEPARHGPRTGAPPPVMLAPGERPTPGIRRAPGPTRPQLSPTPAPGAAAAPGAAPPPASVPPETVEPTPPPEAAPETPPEASPEVEPS